MTVSSAFKMLIRTTMVVVNATISGMVGTVASGVVHVIISVLMAVVDQRRRIDSHASIRQKY